MASTVALRIRENQAIERIAQALGVGVEDLTPEQVKPVMRHTVRLETIAGLLEERNVAEEADSETIESAKALILEYAGFYGFIDPEDAVAFIDPATIEDGVVFEELFDPLVKEKPYLIENVKPAKAAPKSRKAKPKADAE